ncbi:MAG: DUF1508 domain-containing protein [Actinomycetota bacterium]|nr:DUF1508 domain-containing protein [Actinomycetota bacterium]
MAHGTQHTEDELERLAEQFSQGEVEVSAEQPLVIETASGSGTAVLSIRLPRSVISALKAAAEEQGIGATVLARELIVAGIARRGAPDVSWASEAKVSVHDLLTFALAHQSGDSTPRLSGVTKFEIYQADDGRYRWRLKSSTGQVVADSGEGYPTKKAAMSAIDTVFPTHAEVVSS